MEEFLKKVFETDSITPPQSCALAFDANFGGAINVEWNKRDSYFEAVFYKDHIEYIALFDSNGTLIKYKMYQNAELLPELIKQDMEARGEIMNVVLINEGNSIIYEIIVRDQHLKRFLLLISQLGKILEEKPL